MSKVSSSILFPVFPAEGVTVWYRPSPTKVEKKKYLASEEEYSAFRAKAEANPTHVWVRVEVGDFPSLSPKEFALENRQLLQIETSVPRIMAAYAAPEKLVLVDMKSLRNPDQLLPLVEVAMPSDFWWVPCAENTAVDLADPRIGITHFPFNYSHYLGEWMEREKIPLPRLRKQTLYTRNRGAGLTSSPNDWVRGRD